MFRRRRAVALLAVAALAAGAGGIGAPAGAWAQGDAGDQQYQDPFGGDAQAGGTDTQTQTSAGSAQQAQPATTPESGDTGIDNRLVLGVGLVLVAAALLLRRRSVHGRR